LIVYLHGFLSSPASHKAQRLRAHLADRGLGERFWCEQLATRPAAAMVQVEAVIARHPQATLVGSSLGGFYATWLAERHGLKAVLVNPAVVAHLSLAEFVGPQTNLYTGERFDFTPRHVEELRALDVSTISRPERYWLLVETGDELLDYRQAVAKYAGARQTVIEGGDHGFAHFGDYLDGIIGFAGLA
jgi:predicted esterase YcpF (UPF0227 family)